MTVSELISILEEYDGDTEVVIAEYQRYGSDFAYAIGDVADGTYDNWDGDSIDEDGTCVMISLGSQIGTMVGD